VGKTTALEVGLAALLGFGLGAVGARARSAPTSPPTTDIASAPDVPPAPDIAPAADTAPTLDAPRGAASPRLGSSTFPRRATTARTDFAKGPHAARLRSSILRAQAEIDWLRARRSEEEREANPSASGPSFDDDRIFPEHRPEAFEGHVETARERLRREPLSRDTEITDVDCSAVPCIVTVEVAFEPTDEFPYLSADRDFHEELGSLFATTPLGSNSATRWPGPEDGVWNVHLWWHPVDYDVNPLFRQQIEDSAWGRLDADHIPGATP